MLVELEGAPALRHHGGARFEELAQLGVDPEIAVDFSSSVNPYGPCPAVLEAARSARLDRYPDPTAAPLRRAIARATDSAPERVVVGNGAADLLWTLARVLVRPGSRVVIVEPTFAEFRAAAQFAGARVVEHRATAHKGFAVDVEGLESLVIAHAAEVVYLCSPGTPTGSHVPVERVADLARSHPDVTVVLDQAFLSLSEYAAEERRAVPSNVVRVRSLTKDHALAGLRLGYLLAREDLARRLEVARPPWTTSSVAQAAGLAAMGATDFVASSRERLLADKGELAAGLTKLGFEPVPSCACFFVFPTRDAAVLRERLLKRGIVVRDCASFRMPGFVRLAAKPRADRERLLGALREELP
jgi:histidinol-phosphate aminotransferase